MAKKCALCKEKVETTFLQKPLGTWLKNAEGKRFLVCQNCQKQHTIAEMKEKL